ncbi:MAG: hypothetical protein GTO45_18165 [Candidatus Aminicenantes bacterium]|nr:hypothetical protein [Candidatus Aminicenantes bacterium]NIM80713.1 hypothetical protein [Candidatus Aminicenantes bacterium]NIN20088.1 hypothetical protein [Candidatus Aminicenantes bacterium]NIN43875.1 hypothetical protein [Candidatus Aminicenantes bacterium]NIN86684.1 hypothetical protein [Candidatus Aminicenantes bacterium]
MNKLKTRTGLVLTTVCVFVLFLFISFCSNQDDKQMNQRKGEIRQPKEKVSQEEMKGQVGEKKGEPLDVWAKFTAAGWMGDGEYGEKYIQLAEAWKENPHSAPLCIRITYTPGPKKGWAGIYWQNEPDNWGDEPGDNLQKIGYKKLTFWARGENGGEVVEFKAGGINAPGKAYRDSFEVNLGKVVLEKTWKQFTIDLEGQDLSSVIGGFCWVASRAANPKGLTFYLDDIYYK